MEQKNMDGNADGVEDKVFGKIEGKILSDSISFADNSLSFDFKADKNLHRFLVGDKRVISKIFQLYCGSYKKAFRDSVEKEISVGDALRKLVKSNSRSVVLLVDDKVNVVFVVSEQHKQMPLSQAFGLVDKVATKNGAVFVDKRDVAGSYAVTYDIGKNSEMSMRVTAYLGRNDAMGRSGLFFQGGGHIFVCSNMVIPHIDADVKFSSDVKLFATKIVHTLKIEERFKKQLQKSFDCAKKNAILLSDKFVESKSIKMSRALQEHCIKLVTLKNNLPDKWVSYALRQLAEEGETLYGLSQALTYVGTHFAGLDSEIGKRLQRLGGQVVLLGKNFVKLIEKSLTAKGITVPEMRVQ